MSLDINTIPPLAAYLARIHAEVLNFRRFMVRDYKGDHYYVERCLIRVDAEGELKVSNKEYAPTKEEAAAIKGALLSAKFPKHINATPAKLEELYKQVGKGADLFSFLDYSSKGDKDIIMVQERCMIDGRKAYVPWTYWSDGEWRKMEPDGPLPFWKPPERKGSRRKRRIMVHEGAKSASYVDSLVNDEAQREALRQHPWGESLQNFEHWGMIGGALAPHRADYAELVREKPLEVIYVCDNDYPGKAALREVARCYGHAIKGIMFDERFPMSWDMADPVPGNLLTSAGRWVGPDLKQLTQLATWATEQVPNSEGKGRPVSVLRREFAEEWLHCVVPEVFVHRDWPNVIFSSQEFNNRVRPFSDVDDTSRLVKADAAAKSAVLKYSPALKPGIYSGTNGLRYINTHIPTIIKGEKGDAQPWVDFLEHLVPDANDRNELIRWCATLVCRPNTKMLYGVLLISEIQGVGKSTLGEKILAPLIGEDNVSYPSENEVVESDFNYWCAHKRLAVVHEIYAGHSSKAYNKLKNIITDSSITVNKKYQASYQIENWMHIFACSNSMRAIQLSMDDRRWFLPQITEKKKKHVYWAEFNRWLAEDNGLGIIRWWMEEWLKKNGQVSAGDIAPWSKVKKEVIEEGYSPGMTLVAEFLERLKLEAGEKDVVVLDTDLVDLIRFHIHEGRRSDRLERPLTIRKLAKSLGWKVGKEAIRGRGLAAKWVKARAISTSQKMAEMGADEILAEGAWVDVQAKAQGWLL